MTRALRQALERIAMRSEAFAHQGDVMPHDSVEAIVRIARKALESGHERGRLCTGCNQHLPFERFAKASPDFPTRDGYNFKCNDCAPAMRLERDPVTKKVRIKE